MRNYRFGERVALADGSNPVLLEFHPTCGAFVEFDEPRQSVAHHDPTILLGVVRKMWVPFPDWRAVTDSDGVRSGIEYAGL